MDSLDINGVVTAASGAFAGLSALVWRNRRRIAQTLMDSEEKFDGLQASVSALDLSLKAVASRLEIVELDNEDLRQRLAETEAELERVRAQRDAQTAEIARLEAEVTALRHELARRSGSVA